LSSSLGGPRSLESLGRELDPKSGCSPSGSGVASSRVVLPGARRVFLSRAGSRGGAEDADEDADADVEDDDDDDDEDESEW
jgi:hypothetical protein